LEWDQRSKFRVHEDSDAFASVFVAERAGNFDFIGRFDVLTETGLAVLMQAVLQHDAIACVRVLHANVTPELMLVFDKVVRVVKLSEIEDFHSNQLLVDVLLVAFRRQQRFDFLVANFALAADGLEGTHHDSCLALLDRGDQATAAKGMQTILQDDATTNLDSTNANAAVRWLSGEDEGFVVETLEVVEG
jgi:hypothetical protein